MATHSSILSWRIPWIEEPGRLEYALVSFFRKIQNIGVFWLILYSL